MSNKAINADPKTPKHIAQASVSKKVSNNNGNNPPTVVIEVVTMCLVDLTVVETNFFFVIWPSAASSFKCDKTTIASLIASPAKPTIPTNPIKPKF